MSDGGNRSTLLGPLLVNGLLRVYDPAVDAFDRDGYPLAWQTIKHLIREEAGNRCERCGHPYANGSKLNQGWSPCDDRCRHQDDGPVRVVALRDFDHFGPVEAGELCGFYQAYNGGAEIAWAGWEEHAREGLVRIDAQWRILTVHHLNGGKADCRWWNLMSACQRCHLSIQGKVVMERDFIRSHTDWMRPHAAGWYAVKYLGEDLTRDETLARLDELLALELREEALF